MDVGRRRDGSDLVMEERYLATLSSIFFIASIFKEEDETE